MARGLIDIEVHLHHETRPGEDNEGAILVSTDGDKSSAVWIPKSQVQIEDTRSASIISITLAEHVAVDKGLV